MAPVGLLVLTASGNPADAPDGMVVRVRHPHQTEDTPLKMVRLQVLDEKIIRVTATAEERFADRQSLIIVPQQKNVSYEMEEHDDTVTLTTRRLHPLENRRPNG